MKYLTNNEYLPGEELEGDLGHGRLCLQLGTLQQLQQEHILVLLDVALGGSTEILEQTKVLSVVKAKSDQQIKLLRN